MRRGLLAVTALCAVVIGTGVALTIIGVVLLWLSFIWLTTPLI